jgi:hypothetical protein
MADNAFSIRSCKEFSRGMFKIYVAGPVSTYSTLSTIKQDNFLMAWENVFQPFPVLKSAS